MHRAGSVVVGIKEVGVLGNGVVIAGHPFLENERFKKPGGVREVPFGWADFRH